MSPEEPCRSFKEFKEDTVLASLAKGGDRGAFEELIRRHRGKILGLAKSVLRDPHLAEDVVQEAVVQSFLHLGTLSDMSRFLPWLQRIVRNQALISLRRGGRFAKELPVSDFAMENMNDRPRIGKTSHEASAWPAMTPSAMAMPREEEPCELILQKEVLSTIDQLVKRLSKTERAVFEAHFSQELNAKEISRLLQISTASVYMSLSRSRKKLREPLTSSQPGMEDPMRVKSRAVLSKPAIRHSRTGLYNESIRNCIYYALPYVGKGLLGYDEVMALTGHAFQINLEKRNIDLSGVYMYAGTTLFPNGMLNLGLHSSLIDKFGYEKMPDGPLKEELFYHTLGLIKGSIDRGVPAIFAGGVNTQFALYYGYDDDRQSFLAIDTLTEMEIPYSTFRNRHLYGFVIEEAADVEQQEGFRRMLAMAVKHGQGYEATFGGMVNGLPAYDAWIRAFETEAVDPSGNAANIRNVGDMRGYAASFLRKKRHEQASVLSADDPIVFLLNEASEQYEDVACAFRKLKLMFPYPNEGCPVERAAANAAVKLLEQAKAAEEKGLRALEQMLERLTGTGSAPLLIEPNPFWKL